MNNAHRRGEDEGCVRDELRRLQSCVVREWVIFMRSRECDLLRSKARCGDVSGCVWNTKTMVCEVDDAAVAQALGDNTDLTVDVAILDTCLGLEVDRCGGSCVVSGGTCVYPPAVDFMKWFLKDTDDPFCVYQKDVLLCSDREGEDCADDCEIKRTLTALTSTGAHMTHG
eukprot:evm.model.scf_412.8 EVM.evm.TU.scf_412.8   scf_412:69226-71665(+)